MTENEDKRNYIIKIDKNALKFLENLDDFKYNHLIEEIFSLENDPRPVGSVKLNVRDGYRIKWSSFRILFRVNDNEKIIEIYKIDHRKDIYKKR
jgi:mRNA interferase RelE/StbE